MISEMTTSDHVMCFNVPVRPPFVHDILCISHTDLKLGYGDRKRSQSDLLCSYNIAIRVCCAETCRAAPLS